MYFYTVKSSTLVLCIDLCNYHFRNQSAPDNDDEKCLLLQSKNNMALLSEKTLGPFLKDVECESIVCPFLHERQALIIFKTIKGNLDHRK